MTRSKMEARIKALPEPWAGMKKLFQQSRDHQIKQINLSKEDAGVKKAWRKYQQKHYDKLLKKVLELANPANAKKAKKGTK
jgi:hypothetical protein